MKHKGKHVWRPINNSGTQEVWQRIIPNKGRCIITTIVTGNKCKKCGKIDKIPETIISVVRE